MSGCTPDGLQAAHLDWASRIGPFIDGPPTTFGRVGSGRLLTGRRPGSDELDRAVCWRAADLVPTIRAVCWRTVKP